MSDSNARTRGFRLPSPSRLAAMGVEDLRTIHKNAADYNDSRMRGAEADGWCPDPLDLINERLNLILEVVAPGELNRLRFEISYEVRLQERLAAGEAEFARMKLTQGVEGLQLVRDLKQ
jgi:hypothetical protein